MLILFCSLSLIKEILQQNIMQKVKSPKKSDKKISL